MPLVSSNSSHVQRAIDFVRQYQTATWIGIAKSTAWGDPDVFPPYDPVTHPENNYLWVTDTLSDMVGYKRAERVCLVKPDVNGIIEVLDEEGNLTKWTEVTETTAVADGARYVYIKCTLDLTVPNDPFRRTAIFTNLVRKTGVADKMAFTPAEVQTPGILEMIQNHNVQYRANNTRQVVGFIYEF